MTILPLDPTPAARMRRWRRHIHNIACPTCGAGIGQHCRMQPLTLSDGRRSGRDYHLTRNTAARKAIQR